MFNEYKYKDRSKAERATISLGLICMVLLILFIMSIAVGAIKLGKAEANDDRVYVPTMEEIETILIEQGGLEEREAKTVTNLINIAYGNELPDYDIKVDPTGIVYELGESWSFDITTPTDIISFRIYWSSYDGWKLGRFTWPGRYEYEGEA